MTTETGVWFGPWNGTASRAASRLGLPAGRELVLLCLATLASDGRNTLARTAAATQAATMAQRKRTANRPVAAKNRCKAKSPRVVGRHRRGCQLRVAAGPAALRAGHPRAAADCDGIARGRLPWGDHGHQDWRRAVCRTIGRRVIAGQPKSV